VFSLLVLAACARHTQPAEQNGGKTTPGLFFTATDARAGVLDSMGTHGAFAGQLWRTDGTVEGTLKLMDTRTWPEQLTVFAGSVYFAGGDEAHGVELWKSDGTSAGTVLVKDILPGPDSSHPRGTRDRFAVRGDAFYFAATDGVHGIELWRSDGTDGGTVMLRDINPGAGDSYPTGFAALGSELFFQARSATGGSGELWKTDGTSVGTVRVSDRVRVLLADPLDSSGLPVVPLTPLGGSLFFMGSGDMSGTGLWKTDGTADGTVKVKDLGAAGRTGFGVLNGTLLFGITRFDAAQSLRHDELWRSDGSAEGTAIVKPVGIVPCAGPWPLVYPVYGGALYFCARDCGVTNTTPLPPNVVPNLCPGLTEHGVQLWKTDGTAEGTVRVTDIDRVSDPALGGFTVHGGALYFTIDRSLWKTDGTATGTTRVSPEGVALASYEGVVPFDGALYFAGSDEASGLEVWKTDGTMAGTSALTDLCPGPCGTLASQLVDP
jgi:ELWxxDGT repeat protein